MLRIDLHVHTCYSRDCRLSISRLIKTVKKSKLNGLAITDHNQIKGALMVKKQEKSLKIIVGEEIMTENGEIIGLFLQERIPPGLSLTETIARIKKQNGLVYVPHPFDRLRSSAIGEENLDNIIEQIDILEIFNSRNVFLKDNEKAINYSRNYELIPGVGSDAHTSYEVGNSYVEIKDFSNSEDFLQKLKNACLIRQRSNILVHGYTKFIKLFGGLVDGTKSDQEVS